MKYIRKFEIISILIYMKPCLKVYKFGCFFKWKEKSRSFVCGTQLQDLLSMFSDRYWTIHFEIQTWNGVD